MKYTFPFNTCETIHDNTIAQPVSTIINLLSAAVLSVMVLFANHLYTQILFIIFAAFEFYHALSHTRHRHYDKYVIHILSYILAFSLWYTIHALVRLDHMPLLPVILISVAILADIVAYTLTRGHGISTIITGLLVISVAAMSYWPYMPKRIRIRFITLIAGIGVLILLFINEMVNCNLMLKYKRFPYHAIIEIWGLLLFILLGTTFISWESQK